MYVLPLEYFKSHCHNSTKLPLTPRHDHLVHLHYWSTFGAPSELFTRHPSMSFAEEKGPYKNRNLDGTNFHPLNTLCGSSGGV